MHAMTSESLHKNNSFGNSELSRREPKKHLLCTILLCWTLVTLCLITVRCLHSCYSAEFSPRQKQLSNNIRITHIHTYMYIICAYMFPLGRLERSVIDWNPWMWKEKYVYLKMKQYIQSIFPFPFTIFVPCIFYKHRNSSSPFI